MLMLNDKYSDFNKVLFNSNKLIENRNNIEKNISEGLLTFRALIITSPFIHETEESAQLEKMLSACKLQNKDYKIYTLTNDWSYFRNAASIREVLLFGVTEKDLNLNIQMPFNQVIRFDNRVWIKSSSIAEMMKSQEIKNNLWQNALKPHFIG